MTHCCQLCGQPTDNPFLSIHMSPTCRQILNSLPATIDDLVDQVYGDIKHDRVHNYRSLRVTISRLRTLLAPHGFTIDNRLPQHGGKKTYRLVRLSVR